MKATHVPLRKRMGRSGSGSSRSILSTTLLLIAASTCIVIYAITNTFSLSATSAPSGESQWRRLSYQDDSSSSSYADQINEQEQQLANQGVKIYMYDLPRKFTYGIIEQYSKSRGFSVPPENLKYPGNQHSAEWWLFADLSRPYRSPVSPVIRTVDPSEADLFYVPFFSSLSLVVNPKQEDEGPESKRYSDERMQEELVQWLENQPYWRRSRGRDHVIICQDPNALYKVIDKLKNAVLLVSDFGRLRRDHASLVKDIILPYAHRINSFNGEIGVAQRRSLLFFMGNRFRKEGGKVRDLLFQVLEHEEAMIIKHGTQSRESRRLATRGMHSSKFCLHPAGDTPSACRLFDAIVSLCIPVVVSDDIELPFEDVIDYSKIAIFVPSANAVQPGFLASKLRNITEEEILQYQRELKKVKRYFEYEEPDGTVNEIWRQVALKVPLIKLMINRDKRVIERDGALDCSCICPNGNSSVKPFNITHVGGSALF